jgi:protein phosphatase PTC7
LNLERLNRETVTAFTGTDGLWDNAFDDEVIYAVTKEKNIQKAANSLALLARTHASDPEFSSPYIKEALSRGYG